MNKTRDFILVPFGKTGCEMKSSVLQVVISMHSIVFVLNFIALEKSHEKS